MEKLAISKAIMDKHQSISRNGNGAQSYNINTPELETYETPPQAKFNIPDELMMESKPSQQIPQASSKDRILNSKLPDEIKRLMIENPIVATNPLSPSNSVLSDELVEKASRLMGTKKSQSSPTQISEQKTPINSDLKKMMKEVVEEVLKENGLILESNTDTNETMVIKVGKHIFEGKISRIKKTK